MSHSNKDNNVGTGNKLRTLALFKGSCIYEPYLNTVKPEKNTTTKFHENAFKQFSRRLKFTNLASEPQKNSNIPFYVT